MSIRSMEQPRNLLGTPPVHELLKQPATDACAAFAAHPCIPRLPSVTPYWVISAMRGCTPAPRLVSCPLTAASSAACCSAALDSTASVRRSPSAWTASIAVRALSATWSSAWPKPSSTSARAAAPVASTCAPAASARARTSCLRVSVEARVAAACSANRPSWPGVAGLPPSCRWSGASGKVAPSGPLAGAGTPGPVGTGAAGAGAAGAGASTTGAAGTDGACVRLLVAASRAVVVSADGPAPGSGTVGATAAVVDDGLPASRWTDGGRGVVRVGPSQFATARIPAARWRPTTDRGVSTARDAGPAGRSGSTTACAGAEPSA